MEVFASLDWGDVPTSIGAVATVLAFIAAWVAARAAWRVLELERTRDRRRLEVEDRVQADRLAELGRKRLRRSRLTRGMGSES